MRGVILSQVAVSGPTQVLYPHQRIVWVDQLGSVSKGLVTNYGEGGGGCYKTGGGGHQKFYPYEKGGGGKSFSHAEGGGGTKSFGVVFTW